GVDDDGSGVILPYRAFQLLETLVAAAGYAGGHGDELVGMIIATFGEVTVRALDRRQRFLRRLAKADVVHRVADHGPIQAHETVGVQRVLDRHRHRMLPPFRSHVLWIVDVDMPVDEHPSSSQWFASA